MIVRYKFINKIKSELIVVCTTGQNKLESELKVAKFFLIYPKREWSTLWEFTGREIKNYREMKNGERTTEMDI